MKILFEHFFFSRERSTKGKKLEKFFPLCRWRQKKVFSCRAQPCLIVKSITTRKVLARSPMLPVFHRLPLLHFCFLFCCFNFRMKRNAKRKRKENKIALWVHSSFLFLLRLNKTPVKYTKGHRDNIHKFPLMRKMWQRRNLGENLTPTFRRPEFRSDRNKLNQNVRGYGVEC